MRLQTELAQELESTHQNFHHLLDSIPEASYVHPSDNPARNIGEIQRNERGNPTWTIGDVLYHITIGTIAIRFEIWMIRMAPGLIQFALNDSTSKLINWINAPFARRGQRVTCQRLIKAYEAGHAGLMSSLKRMREVDWGKSVIYPAAFVSELAGVVTVERLFRYVKLHFDVHAGQIQKKLAKIAAD